MSPGLKRGTAAFIVFVALWLDGSFYPLILLPFLYLTLYERRSPEAIGFSRSRLHLSALLGLGAGAAISLLYYPIFVHYLSRRQWGGLSPLALLTDVVWYPLYEEVAYRGFFLGMFAGSGGGLTQRNLALNLIQTLFFVSVHQNHIREGLPLLLIPVAAIGLAMGLVFLRTRNIAGCVVGHGLLNGVAHLYWLFPRAVG